MRSTLVAVASTAVCLLFGATASAQTFEPRPFPQARAANLIAPPPPGGTQTATAEPQLLPQAGVELGNQKLTVSVQALRLHVKGHPEIKFYVLSSLAALTETPAAGQTPSSKPAERLQHALIDAAGGIANFGFARSYDGGFLSFDVRGGGKLIEVPEAADPTASPASTAPGYELRMVADASGKFEFRVPLEDEQNNDAGSIFANATAVYNYLQNDIASRFLTSLNNHNLNVNAAVGIDLPAAHLYLSGVFSLYVNDGQFGKRFAFTFNPHR